MVPLLVFLGVAALVGCLILGIVVVRLRAAARRPAVTDAELCSLRQARRISTAAVAASLAGLAVLGLASAVLSRA